MPLAWAIALTVVLKRRAIAERVSPGCTMYVWLPVGGGVGVGVTPGGGVGVGVASPVGISSS